MIALRATLTAAIVALELVGSSAGAGPLANATSPYLLRHADDAIAWQPWGRDALRQAKRENKLIYVSIGYAACHWCHVMARTTFKDPAVIDRLNADFVSILVDREERPDLDHHFMTIMDAMEGQHGWPANFFLTPDQVPLFAAGFLDANSSAGRPGLIEIATYLASEWQGQGSAIRQSVDRIKSQLAVLFRRPALNAMSNGPDPAETARDAWLAKLDETHGGFRPAPKFPHPNVLSSLLYQAVRRRDDGLLQKVLATLDQMAAGGLRDQLGGAFHRYAVDRAWRVPHFEIMLNDNALLARLYLDAYQASGKPRYRQVARGILDAVRMSFLTSDGGLASALDADSGGGEGRYYTWTVAEIESALPGTAAQAFTDAYLDETSGQVDGRSVVRLLAGGTRLIATERRLAKSRTRLLAARHRRARPARDDKVLTDWNAMAASAFARAAQITGSLEDAQLAEQLVDTVATKPGLIHTRLGDRAGQVVFLDDYAFAVLALIDLYETTFKPHHLDRARALMEQMIDRFQPAPGQPFQFAPVAAGSALPPQTVLTEDGAPSGNAAALLAMRRLALFADPDPFETEAKAILRGLQGYLQKQVAAAPSLVAVLGFDDTAREIVIVGAREDPATQDLLAEIRRRLMPATVVAVIPPDAAETNADWPLLAARPLLHDKPTAYVCRRRLCRFPVNQPADLARQLDGIAPTQ